MAYDDLREFVRALEKHKELKRISFEVDPDLEITEFADRAVKSGGPALLFEKPEGLDVPVLINAFASMRRMEIALEVASVDEVARRIYEFLEMRMPEGIIGKLKMLPKLAEMGAFFPKIVSDGPCKEVVRREDFSLDYFPILKCWPEDGGRFITLPMVFSKNPDTGKRNCGCYRLQVYDERTTGMHWQTHKQGAEHYRRMRARGETKRMDVAVAIGADPATMYSAILPLPPDLDEMMIAGFLRVEAGRNGEVRNGAISKCPRTRRSCSKVTSNWANCAAKARSAITPDFIRWKTIIRCSTSRASRIERIRSTRRRSWVRRRWRIFTWARRSSGFFCR